MPVPQQNEKLCAQILIHVVAVLREMSADIEEWTDYICRQKRVQEENTRLLCTPGVYCSYCLGPTPPALGERVLVTHHVLMLHGISSVTQDKFKKYKYLFICTYSMCLCSFNI